MNLPVAGGGGSFSDGALSAWVERLLEQQQRMMREQREEMKADAREVEARVERHREHMEAKMERQRAEFEARVLALQQAAAAEARPAEAVSKEELSAFESRLEQLHAAGLLSDDDLCAAEDLTADFIQIKATVKAVTVDMVHSNAVVGKLHALVALSEGMTKDASFARQLRRQLQLQPAPTADDLVHDDSGIVPQQQQQQQQQQQPPLMRGTSTSSAMMRSESPSLRSTRSAVAPVSTIGTIEDWLEGIGLTEYLEPIVSAGYSSLRFVKAASEEDLEELAADIEMKKLHAKLLAAAWAKLQR
jgi:hypothetical protein